MLQGMYYTYFVSVITTIEKLFQIKSKTTGMLMSATEVGQISTSLFLTYYAGNGNRPKWIACSKYTKTPAYTTNPLTELAKHKVKKKNS